MIYVISSRMLKQKTMKKSLLVLSVIFGLALQAQVIPNASYTDCNNNTHDIYSEIATGKVLVIALDGLDCAICKSHAANYQSFINQNTNIAGWGAMIWLYASGTPNCTDVGSWVNTYGWTDIFTFIDSNEFWLKSSAPRYVVVNPADSNVVYDGGNFSMMKQVAAQYASTVGISENSLTNNFTVFQKELEIGVISSVQLKDGATATLYNLIGQEELSWSEIESESNFTLPVNKVLTDGIYLLRIKSGAEVVTKKIIWQN